MKKLIYLAFLLACLGASSQQISSSSILRLEIEGEYLSVYDTVPDPDVRVLHEIASNIQFKWMSGDPNSSNYNKLTLSHSLDYNRVRVPFVDKFSFSGDNILNSSDVAYDRSGLETFLSTNTGFSWAGIATASSTQEVNSVIYSNSDQRLFIGDNPTTASPTTDPPGATVSYSATGVPSFMSFSTSTGVLTQTGAVDGTWSRVIITANGTGDYTGSAIDTVDIVGYVAPPENPTKGTTTSITLAVNGETIQEPELNGNYDIDIGDDWPDRIDLNGVTGTRKQPYNFHLNGHTIGGGSITASQQVWSNYLNGTNWINVYGDGFLTGNGEGIAGISGTNAPVSADGGVWSIQRVMSYGMTFANFQAALNGSPSTYYEFLSYRYVKASGTDVEGEVIYVGNQSTTSYSTIRNIRVNNLVGVRKDRDLIQLNLGVAEDHTDYGLWASNITGIDGGRGEAANQDAMFTMQNINGLVENSIFDTAPTAGVIRSNGLHFQNNFFNITATNPFFFGDTEGSYNGEEAENNEPILFEDCIFRLDESSTLTSQLFRWFEDDCDLIFLNCTFAGTSGLTELITDERSDQVTYSITNTNPTYVALSEVPAPTYTAETTTYPFVESNYDLFGLVTSKYHYDLGMGAFTPPPSKPGGELMVDAVKKDTDEAILGYSSNLSGGTIYYVLTTSTTKPTQTQIENGQDHTGSATPNGTSVPSTAFSYTELTVAGLANSTAYTAHFFHKTDVDGRVFSAPTITTDAEETPVTAFVNIRSNGTDENDDPNGYYWNETGSTVNSDLTNIVDSVNVATAWDITTNNFFNQTSNGGLNASDYNGFPSKAWDSYYYEDGTNATANATIVISDLETSGYTYNITVASSTVLSGSRNTEVECTDNAGTTSSGTMTSAASTDVHTFSGQVPDGSGEITLEVKPAADGSFNGFINFIKITQIPN